MLAHSSDCTVPGTEHYTVRSSVQARHRAIRVQTGYIQMNSKHAMRVHESLVLDPLHRPVAKQERARNHCVSALLVEFALILDCKVRCVQQPTYCHQWGNLTRKRNPPSHLPKCADTTMRNASPHGSPLQFRRIKCRTRLSASFRSMPFRRRVQAN